MGLRSAHQNRRDFFINDNEASSVFEDFVGLVETANDGSSQISNVSHTFR